MALEVYINDSLIELEDEKKIGITFQAMSIIDINNRAGSLTNKFKVPKTRINTAILKNLSNINSDTNIPYRRNSAKVIQNGRELFSNAFALIGSTSKAYSVTVYSGNVSFFDLIKGKNINELDWSGSIHIYDIPTIIASFSQVDKFIYPIVDWGDGVDLLDNSTLQNADALIPCAFISEVLEKIATEAEYELIGSFKDTQEYPRLILSPNQFGFTQEQVDAENGFATDVVPDGGFILTVIHSLLTATGPTETIPVPLIYNTHSQPTFTFHNFTPNFAMFGILTFYYKISFVGGSSVFNSLVEINFLILEDGVPIATKPVTTNTFFGVNKNESVSTALVLLKPTSVYSVEIEIIATRHPTLDYNFRHDLKASSFSLSMSRNIPITATMPFGTLFDQGQEKIYKDIMRMYSLVSQTNDLTKQVSLDPLDDLIANKSKARDWSDKIDLSKPVNVKYRIGKYGQLNYMKYAEDDDVTVNTGRGSFTIDDDNLPEVKDVVQLVSAASEKEFRVNNEDTPTIPFQPIVGSIFDKKKSRILLLDKKNIVLDLKTTVNNDTGQATVNIPFCYFQKDGKTDSLDFPNLIQANYSTLLGILNKVKAVSASFILNEADVANFDFTIPTFLDVHHEQENINGYFYTDKISNFKSSSSIKVDLIRL